MVITVNSNVDLIFSPDDEGWYFHNHTTDKTSQIFEHKDQAVIAWHKKDIVWQ